jgi:MFS family permease
MMPLTARPRTSPHVRSAAPSLAITLQIVSIVFYTFIAFLCIGLPIAVLPGYVHEQLGFSAVVAGLTIGSQYLATLLSRPMAGRMSDTVGTKRAIVLGLSGIVLSGVLTFSRPAAEPAGAEPADPDRRRCCSAWPRA